MTERTLASIRRIREIRPILGADAIEVALIEGWQVVVKKDDHFKAGDLVVYFEIDSVLPELPVFEFMRKHKFRLRTIKLRGQISQGLVMPLGSVGIATGGIEGFDVTGMLGVTKWDPPLPTAISGIALGLYPNFIQKTDQERIQNLLERLGEWEKVDPPLTFEISEKLDGTSMTVFHKEDQLHVCSRNLELKETEDNTLWRVAREMNLDAMLRDSQWVLQGELCGPGIQGNPLKLKKVQFFVFDVCDWSNHRKLSPPERRKILDDCQFPPENRVPVDSLDAPVSSDPGWIERLLATAAGPSALNPGAPREGLVFKCNTRLGDKESGELISFKAISNDYLLGGK